MDRYNTPQEATIFNFKNIYNKLIEDLSFVNNQNLLTNPNFREEREGEIFTWSNNNQLEYIGDYDEDKNSRFLRWLEPASPITPDGLFWQTINQYKLEVNTDYTFIIEMEKDIATLENEISIDILGGADDLFASIYSEQIDNTLIRHFVELDREIHIVRFKTRENSALTGRFNSDIMIALRHHNITGAGNPWFRINNIALVQGNLAFLNPEYNELNGKVRFHDHETDESERYWEISVDNEVTWERLMTDNQYLEDRIEELIEAHMLSAVRQSNIIAGSNIDIDYGSIDDGEGHIIPTLTISSTAVGGTSGGGTGDWTREDMIYQALLEQSDFSYASYNTLMEEQNVTFTGGAYYDGSEDDTGSGKVIGYTSDTFIIDDLVTEKGVDHFSFYVHAETNLGVDAREVVDLEYDASTDGVIWTGWTACGLKEYITTNDVFKYLKLRFTFKGAGQRNITSYGLMYGYDQLSGNASNGFVEVHQVTAVDEAATEATIALPNGRWYHKDGKSLEVFYDGNRLLEGVDYVEVNAGFPDKSNAVTFLVDLVEDKYIVFKEIYGKTSTTSLASTQPWMSISANYSANTFNKILVDTTSNAVTVTIPQNPNVGDEIQIADMKGTFAINNLTLHSDNHVIQNSYYNFIIDDNLAHVTLVFVNATVGWRVYHYYSFTK